MKRITEYIENKEMADTNIKLISRKEAIKKTAYIAVSAATFMILLGKPNQAHATSPSPPPGF